LIKAVIKNFGQVEDMVVLTKGRCLERDVIELRRFSFGIQSLTGPDAEIGADQPTVGIVGVAVE
jgi:hypothetical protein